MSIKQITGTVKNSDGASAPFTGTITVTDPPVITSVTVAPLSAPTGTPRTITVVARDPAGLALTYACSVDGVVLPATATPGVFVWTG